MSVSHPQKILILGIRGIPAEHGGFETFAEEFALYLKNKSWDVTVYCQGDFRGETYETHWNGIRLVHIGVPDDMGPLGTIKFDMLSVMHAAKQPGIVLTLGYNTAFLSLLHRFKGQYNIMNMDGIEWRREKWSSLQKVWLYLNEWFGARFANHLVADHPEIKAHLMRHTADKKITVIPYGAEPVVSPSESPLEEYGLKANQYAIVVARPEPENSILTIVKGYMQAQLDIPLVVLGRYSPEENDYHRRVLSAGDENIKFIGTCYDSEKLSSLRAHARFYLHGHTVGGTNPSLIEAMAANNCIIAHDNPFNRWVVGDGGLFFSCVSSLTEILQKIMSNDEQVQQSVKKITNRHREMFLPEGICKAYEELLLAKPGSCIKQHNSED